MSNFEFRVVAVRYIDELFYEKGSARRNHRKANELFTRQLCGIGEDTHWDYLHFDPEKIKGYELSEDIKMMLWLLVKLFKLMPKTEVIRFLWMLRREIERVERVALRNRRKVDNADRLFDSLFPDIER